MKKPREQRVRYFVSEKISPLSTANKANALLFVLEKCFQTIGRAGFISAGCLLLALGALNAHSANGECKRKFTKPKRVKLLSPEEISSLSREETHALRPKHLFLSKKIEDWGDLRLTVEQFQALNINALHPETLEQIAERPVTRWLLSDKQIQELNLRTIPPGILYSLMGPPAGVRLSERFKQELHPGAWSQRQLEPFIKDPTSRNL